MSDNKRSKQSQSVSLELLESYRKALYNVKIFFDTVNIDSLEDPEVKAKMAKHIMEIGDKIGKNVESLDRLEEKVKREEKELSSRRGQANSSMFED